MIRMTSVRNTVNSIFFYLVLVKEVSVAEPPHMDITGCSSANSGHSRVTSFEQGWPILQEAVDKLIDMFEGFDNQITFTSNDYLRYYTVAYELSTARDGEDKRLYEQYKKVFEEYITSKVVPSLRGKKGNDFLQELIKRWSNHKTMTVWLSRFFNYINRYYVTSRRLPSLTEASFLSFYEMVYGEMNDQVIDAVLSMIVFENDEEQIDQDLIDNILVIYVEMASGSMKYYMKDFEEALLRKSTIYFEREPNWISISHNDLMLKANDFLKNKREMVLNHLHNRNLQNSVKEKDRSGSPKAITLVSSDGEVFEVDDAIACQSHTIKHLIEDGCTNGDSIHLPLVTSKILTKVIEFCKKHVDSSNLEDHVLDSDLQTWDEDFVKVEHSTLFEYILAANYLNIKSLLELASDTVGNMIKGKNPDEIRKLFNITDSVPPESQLAFE